MRFEICERLEDEYNLPVLDTINIRENILFDTAIFNLIKKLEKEYNKELVLFPVADRKLYCHAYPDGNLITTEEDRSKWKEPDYNPEITEEVILKYITSNAGIFAPAHNEETRRYSDFECDNFDLRK